MPADEAESESWWRPRRKKIVSHEVSRAHGNGRDKAHVEREMRDAAEGFEPVDDGPDDAAPVHVVVVPVGTLSTKIARPPDAVMDPSALGIRHRKHRHKFAYRMTVVTTTLSLATATLSIVCELVDDDFSARLNATAAVLLAIGSLRLVRLTQLSSRLRGYAVAAGALAGIALAVTLGMVFFHDDQGRAKGVTSSPNAAPAPVLAPAGPVPPGGPPGNPRQF
jgi:hypothetical protein